MPLLPPAQQKFPAFNSVNALLAFVGDDWRACAMVRLAMLQFATVVASRRTAMLRQL